MMMAGLEPAIIIRNKEQFCRTGQGQSLILLKMSIWAMCCAFRLYDRCMSFRFL